MNVLEITNLSKKFGGFRALNEVVRGEVEEVSGVGHEAELGWQKRQD